MAKPWLRWSGGVPSLLVRPDGKPVVDDDCCCACKPTCAYVEVTVGDESYETQLELSGAPVDCTGQPAGTTRCRYVQSTACLIYPQSVELHRRCDGDWELLVAVSGVWVTSDPQGSAYGAYTFPVGSGVTATVIARDPQLCGGTACVSYLRVGETWDVVRLCVPACAIPADWVNGWLEDFTDNEWEDPTDYFQCAVVTLGCPACAWVGASAWYGQNLCLTRDGYSYTLTWCPPFPDENSGACKNYWRPASWYSQPGTDSYKLYLGWNGDWVFVWNSFSLGARRSYASGPYGTYDDGLGNTAEVYPCPA